MLDNKNKFQERILSHRHAEYNRMIVEAREKLEQVKRADREMMETRQKLMYYLRGEEDRQRRACEEEEARNGQEEEKRKREEAELKAKLDEIAEKQRQKAIEPKPFELGARPVEPLSAPAAAAAPTPGKYVPRYRRAEVAPHAPLSAEPDRWGSRRGEDRAGDRWQGNRGGSSRPTSWSSARPSR